MGAAPPSPSSQRVLAAIVVTDAVGFSARMSADEERALALIHKDLDHIGQLCEQYEGQVLKTTGDGLLMYFFSAVQAVDCALAVQKSLGGNSDVTSDHFVHRIGIHLGDVYINESDMMGTGVNIAARLEAFAPPGEICASQIVYDVVKSRLELDATFLGPLSLKNIQEPVPAYQIRPAIAAEPEKTDPTLPFATRSSPEVTLEQALQTLSQHPNHLRIKKLLFGTCQNLWENDATVLDQFSLRGLIEGLVTRNPSLEQCRASLYRIVATLNRKETYSEVAEAILAAVTPIYGSPSAAQLLTPSSSPSGAADIKDRYQQVAQILDQDAQSIRIKKVLYCLCHKVWEKDQQKVDQADTEILVEQLYQLAPSPRDLKYRLRYLLQHLNRKAQYTKVVDTIFRAFSPLYSAAAELALVSTPGLQHASDSTSPNTCFAATPAPTHPEATVAYSAQPLTPIPAVAAAEIRDRTDLFELRLDIIKYCNPLRAKILLYSTLQSPFTGSPVEWAVLRNKTLEDFLREAFEYCPTFSDLESKLTIISHCLDDPNENEPVISAILMAIEPYYPKVQPSVPQRGSQPVAAMAEPAAR